MLEATDSGLKCVIGVSVKVSDLILKVRPIGHQQIGMKSAALWVAAVLWLPLGPAEWVGWAGLLASKSLDSKCIPLQLVLVSVAVEMSVAQMLMLHFIS